MDYTKGQPEAKESSVSLGMSCQKRYCRKPAPVAPLPLSPPDEAPFGSAAIEVDILANAKQHAEEIVNQVLAKAVDDDGWDEDRQVSQ